jgi:hypothetical protein
MKGNGAKENILREALFKLATGLEYEETTEEKDGEGNLLKSKTVKKYLPPDIAAMKWYLLGEAGTNVADMTDEELEKEWARLRSEKHEM